MTSYNAYLKYVDRDIHDAEVLLFDRTSAPDVIKETISLGETLSALSYKEIGESISKVTSDFWFDKTNAFLFKNGLFSYHAEGIQFLTIEINTSRQVSDEVFDKIREIICRQCKITLSQYKRIFEEECSSNYFGNEMFLKREFDMDIDVRLPKDIIEDIYQYTERIIKYDSGYTVEGILRDNIDFFKRDLVFRNGKGKLV